MLFSSYNVNKANSSFKLKYKLFLHKTTKWLSYKISDVTFDLTAFS